LGRRGPVLFFLLVVSSRYFSQALARSSIVTGANGYVGRQVVKTLLEEECHPVYCLVRESRVKSEKEYWSQKTNDVTVLPYDMLDGGKSLTNALKQACSSDESDSDVCVYHIASVFGPSENHIQTAKDNVQGTEDVVSSVAKYPNCKLVVTSSMAAVRGSGQTPLNGKFYTHEDWNTHSKLGDGWGSSYQWSKAESEKRAWDLAKELNVPMSVICPSFVFGPPTDYKQLSQSYSIELVGQWVRGESPVQSRLCVDIRDVALAHVAASRQMGERFIVSAEERVPSKDMAQALMQVCRESGLGDADRITFDADFQGGAIPIGEQEVEATERLEQILGIKLRPVEETISDMGRALLQASAPPKAPGAK